MPFVVPWPKAKKQSVTVESAVPLEETRTSADESHTPTTPETIAETVERAPMRKPTAVVGK